MNDAGNEWLRFLTALVPAIFFIWLFWAAQRRRDAVVIVCDEPTGASYRIYTDRFDQQVAGDALPALLRGPTSDRARGWSTQDDMFWNGRIAAAEGMIKAAPPASAHLADMLRRHPDDWALTLLVDMSGSMKGDPITHVAAQVRSLCDTLYDHAIPVALLGFSTMGWHGGRAAEEWRLAGRPARPGRLCALLHMQFKEFDRPLGCAAWRAMLHPDALRENVDGEALLWAAELTRQRPERRKLLLILSDGAPVDDATLAHNGPSYLERHLVDNIGALTQGDVLLGAIGVGFAVDRYYPTAFAVGDLMDITPAIVDMTDQLLSMTHPSARTMH